MDNSQIDQLCLQYNHWNADRKNERYDHLEYIDHPNYVEIKVNGRLDENPIGQNCKKLVPQHKYTVPYWPLFTLRPTMNRVSTILKCKYFDTHDWNWPVFFEYMYSCEWIKHNVRIACFRDKYVIRKKNHTSTYSKSNLNRIK